MFNLANAAVEEPDGTVREVAFPVIGEQTLRNLVRESKATGRTYRTTLRATIRSSYCGHYCRAVLDLLPALDFRSNNDVYRPVIQALDLIHRYAATRLRYYPFEKDVPLDGIVRPLWRGAVVDQDPQGRPRIDRITYEICALETLREQLRCKKVWVAGATLSLAHAIRAIPYRRSVSCRAARRCWTCKRRTGANPMVEARDEAV